MDVIKVTVAPHESNNKPVLTWSDDGHDVLVMIPTKKKKEYCKASPIIRNNSKLSLTVSQNKWKLAFEQNENTLICFLDNVDKITVSIFKMKFNRELTIHAPFIEIKYPGKAETVLNLISSTDIFVNEKLSCDEIFLVAKNKITLAREAIIECQTIKLKSKQCFLDGIICNDRNNRIMELNIDAGIFHLSTDGKIGIRYDGKCTNAITGYINASLENFGSLVSNFTISLSIKEISSLKNNKNDTAQRLNKSKRGQIKSKFINLDIKESLEDLAQISGICVNLLVGGRCICEESSKCSGTLLNIQSSKIVNVYGTVEFNQVRIRAIKFLEIGNAGIIDAMNISFTVGEFIHLAKNAGVRINGRIIADQFGCESSGYFILNENSVFDGVKNAFITSNSFYNNIILHIKLNFYLDTNKFVQHSSAKVNVGNHFYFKANCDKLCKGSIKAYSFEIIPKNCIAVYFHINCEKSELIIDHEKALFCLNDFMNVNQKLHVTQHKSVFNSEGLHKVYNFEINGNLSTKQIVAKNTAIKLNTNGCIDFSKSDKSEFHLHADQINICNNSAIILPSVSTASNIICNRTLFCEGNIKLPSNPNIIKQKLINSQDELLIQGVIKSSKLEIKSENKKDIKIDSVIEANEINIIANKTELNICDESLLDCHKITITAKKANLFGAIYNYSYSNQLLFDANVEVLILTGNIGLKDNECVTHQIFGEIRGDFVNYGIVESNDILNLKIYNLLKTELTEIGAPLHKPRIKSSKLVINCEKDCEDCSQLNGNEMEIFAKGNMFCCHNTNWVAEVLDMYVRENFIVHGNINLNAAKILSHGKIFTASSSNVDINTVNIICKIFEQCGRWTSKDLTFHKSFNDSVFAKISHQIDKVNDASKEDINELIFKGICTVSTLISERSKCLQIEENVNVTLKSKTINIVLIGDCNISGAVECDECKIETLTSSNVHTNGDYSCNKIFTLTKTHAHLPKADSQKRNTLEVGGYLSSQSIDADDFVIEINPKGIIFIHNNESDNSDMFGIKCYNMRLHDKSILSIGSSKNIRKIICKNEWFQQGNLIIGEAKNVMDLKKQNSTQNESLLLFQGNVEARKITVTSIVEGMNLHIDGKMNADNVKLLMKKEKICISKKSIISCKSITATASFIFHFGVIQAKVIDGVMKNEELKLTVGELVIGKEGMVGNDELNLVSLVCTKNLLNFGNIIAKNVLEIELQTLLSTSKNSFPKHEFAVFVSGNDDNSYSDASIIKAKKIIVKAAESIQDFSDLCGTNVNILADNDITCEAGTQWKSKILTLCAKNKFIVEGKIEELLFAKFKANEIVTTSTGFVAADNTVMETTKFECFGEWQCEDFTLKDIESEDFQANQTKDIHFMELLSKNEYYAIQKLLEEQFCKSFRIQGGGKFLSPRAKICAELFHNEGTVEIRNFTLFSHILQQDINGQITANESLIICINDASSFSGTVNAKELGITVFETFKSSAIIEEAKNAIISLFDSKISTFEVNNQLTVIGPLTIVSLEPERNYHNEPKENESGFVIKGTVTAETVQSEVLILVEENAKLILEKSSEIINNNETVLLDLNSVTVKENGTLKAFKYGNTDITMKMLDKVVFNGIFPSQNDSDGVDCLSYLINDPKKETINFTEFLANLHLF